MWHSSASGHYAKEELRELALKELEGVGDPSHQWEEWTGRAYHIRRRLTEAEQEITGPAVDCRGTGEWAKRYYDIAHKLPEMAKRLATEEM